MTEDTFKTRLAKMVEQIKHLPEAEQGRLMELAAETQTRHVVMQKSFGRIHEAFEDLRLCLAYAQFDLEATRRERDSLQ